jgi:hypothetical protein
VDKNKEVIRMKKVIVGIVSFTVGSIVGYGLLSKFVKKSADNLEKKVDKFKTYYSMQNQWLQLKQEGKSLEGYFLEKGYHSIAIYGMGEMGNHLYEELKNTQIKVAYGIDKNASGTYAEIDIFSLEDNLEKVDAIVVTAVFDFCKIEEEIREQFDCPIISLEEVVFGVS